MKMELLGTIYRDKKANPEGKTILREAVRGVIFCEGKLLMVYSTVNGDYKFPGGGVDAGETHLDALRREISERFSERAVVSLSIAAATGRTWSVVKRGLGHGHVCQAVKIEREVIKLTRFEDQAVC